MSIVRAEIVILTNIFALTIKNITVAIIINTLNKAVLAPILINNRKKTGTPKYLIFYLNNFHFLQIILLKKLVPDLSTCRSTRVSFLSIQKKKYW